MDRPILTLAGNYRASNRFALIYEGWFLPDWESESQPIMGSLRFLGKDFSFDFGGLTTFNLLGEKFHFTNRKLCVLPKLNLLISVILNMNS